MRCDTVRAALLDFLNSETGPVRAWAIRRHLASCAACTQELAVLQRFKATLHRADLVPPDPLLVPAPARRVPPRRALALALAALTVGGLLLLPALNQSRRNAQNPGAAIAAALGRVNTWHFSGWKLIDGQKVPWDVWGRRSPWLYYERVGDMTTWTDGKQRLRVFAPNPALKRPGGLMIKTTADQDHFDLGFLADPAYQTLVNSRQTRVNFGDGATTLYQQTDSIARFRSQDPLGVSRGVNANKLYVISKQDWLPTTYQRHFDSRTFARDTEYLSVRYDVDLPDALLSPPAADGYSVVDLTPSAEHTNGFRVDAHPAGMDKEGNVIVVARGWLGSTRLAPGSAFSLDIQPYNGTVSGELRGRQIKYLYATNFSLPPGADISMPFAPLEPSEVGHALPAALLLTMTATPQILVRSSDQIDSDGSLRSVTQSERLISKEFQWRLTLPKPVPILTAVVRGYPGRRFQTSSEYALAESRRIYYWQGYDYTYAALLKAAPSLARTGVLNPNGTLSPTVSGYEKVESVRKNHPALFKSEERKFRMHSVYWQQRKLLLLPRGGATHEERERNRWRHASDVALLAECYRKAGDKAGQDRTLRALIQECLTLPQQGGLLRRQAEWSLRTGQFSEDVGYKGPS